MRAIPAATRIYLRLRSRIAMPLQDRAQLLMGLLVLLLRQHQGRLWEEMEAVGVVGVVGFGLRCVG